MTENCAGKTLVEEQLKAIADKDAATLVMSQKLIDEWLPKLKADLCCVKVPRVSSYFSWKHFWMKEKLVYENIDIRSGMCGRVEDINEQYICIVIYPGNDCGFSFMSGSVKVILHTDQGKILTTSSAGDEVEFTYEDFMKKLAKKIADYSSEVIKEFNRDNQ